MMKQTKTYGLSERVLAGILSLCMVLSAVSGLGLIHAVVNAAGEVPMSGTSGATQHIVADSRAADPNTMDTYLQRLLTLESGSRYAGRVWSDKSVFAYKDTKRAEENYATKGGFNGTDTLHLDMATDGYNGDVIFDADFLHVFSTLASSQVVDEYPPSAPITKTSGRRSW